MLYVTGLTGHSGIWFLKRLESEGYQGKIRCVMRESRETNPDKDDIFKHTGLDIEFVIGDLADTEFLNESMKGVDAILHIAGISHSPFIIDVAIKNKVGWAILIHTTGRFSKFKSASAEYIKIEDEILKRCKDSDTDGYRLNCTVLRPTMIYGSSKDLNMYRLVDYLSRHKIFPLFGDGSNLMQPVHARDLGNAYYNVLMNPQATMNKEYNLTGKNPITYLDIIKTIRAGLNSKVRIIKIPISVSIFAVQIYNKLFRNAIITVEQVMRMQEDKAFSHEDAKKDFGYNPIAFEEGILEEVQEYQNGIRIDYSGVRY